MSIQEKTKGLLKKLPSDISPQNALSAFENIMKYKAEIAKSESEIKKLDVTQNVMLTEIDKKYELYHKIFNSIFSERRETIDKYFEIIDLGIKQNNNELINAGLTNLCNVVSSSPFSNLSELGKLIESGKTIEL
jgi:hypothetical protein